MIMRLLQTIGGVLLFGGVCWGASSAISQFQQDQSVWTVLRLMIAIPGAWVLLLLGTALVILGLLGFKH